MSAEAIIKHVSDGRLRLRIPYMVENPEFFEGLRRELRSYEVRLELSPNPLTGSLLIESDDPAAIARWIDKAEDLDLLHVISDTEQAPSDQIAAELQRIWRICDRLVLRLSGKRLDLKLLLFFALGGFGVMQMKKGKWLPAGLTLLLNGLAILQFSRRPAQNAEN